MLASRNAFTDFQTNSAPSPIDWFSALPTTDPLDDLSEEDLRKMWVETKRPGALVSGLFNKTRDNLHSGLDVLLDHDGLVDWTLITLSYMKPSRSTLQAEIHLVLSGKIPLPTLLQLRYVVPGRSSTIYGTYTGFGPGLPASQLAEKPSNSRLVPWK